MPSPHHHNKQKRPIKDAASESRPLPRTKKVLGQHWLSDPAIIQAIVDAVDITPKDTVVEIGPGPGILTEPLAKKNPQMLHAIELDKRLAERLEEQFEANPKVTIHRGDILAFDYSTIGETEPIQRKEEPEKEQEKSAPHHHPTPFKIIGNLPYQITSLILFHLFGELDDTQHPWRHRIQSATLMIQKEVADRLMAKPSTKGYNALSIYAQLLCDVTHIVDVPPKAFRPPPKVNSAVVQLTPLTQPRYHITNPTRLKTLIKTAFQQRRKTLRNSLQPLLNDTLQAELFSKIEQSPTEPYPLDRPLTQLRPDAIPIPTWVTLANEWEAYLTQSNPSS